MKTPMTNMNAAGKEVKSLQAIRFFESGSLFALDAATSRCDSDFNNTRQASDLWSCSNRRVTLFWGGL